MQENRRLRLQSAILEELSQFVSREVKDPRIPAITFTEIQVTQDGSHATIFVSILGSGISTVDEQGNEADEATIAARQKLADQRMKACLEGLNAAQGFMRRHLGRVLNVRHIPTLAFREDRGFINANRVHELLIKLENDGKGTGTKQE
jgi:ribosome-binding factor A